MLCTEQLHWFRYCPCDTIHPNQCHVAAVHVCVYTHCACVHVCVHVCMCVCVCVFACVKCDSLFLGTIVYLKITLCYYNPDSVSNQLLCHSWKTLSTLLLWRLHTLVNIFLVGLIPIQILRFSLPQKKILGLVYKCYYFSCNYVRVNYELWGRVNGVC